MKKRTAFLVLAAMLLCLAVGLAAPVQSYDTLNDAVAMAANYIGNMNSSIFHYARCHYVSKMSDYNKTYFDSREEAVNSGYRPCKVCKP